MVVRSVTARVYVRVSRPNEADILANQRIAAVTHAAALGHPADEVIVYDETVSGGKEDRPGLGLLLRQLRPGDLVIFTSLSRMTRGGIGAALDILHQIERIGAGWHFVEQPMLNWDSSTPKLAKDILLAVFAAIDEDYRHRISDATKAAFARRRALNPNWRGPGRPRKSGQWATRTLSKRVKVTLYEPGGNRSPPKRRKRKRATD